MSTGTALFIYLFFQNLKETEKLINDEKLVHCNVELSIIMQKALGRGNKSYILKAVIYKENLSTPVKGWTSLYNVIPNPLFN